MLHSIVMNTVNTHYTALASKLSDLDGSGPSGVIIKRLLFEALDAFLPLWLLGVVRRDEEALAEEVKGLFMQDQARRMVVESVLPFISSPQAKAFFQIVLLRSRQANVASKNRAAFLMELFSYQYEKSSAGRRRAKTEVLEHSETLDEWEEFDDWLEMLTQFAYLVLFGADALYVFPIALGSNLLEARSDVFKMCCVMRRPSPEPYADVSQTLETWQRVLTFIAWTGAAFNTVKAVQVLTA